MRRTTAVGMALLCIAAASVASAGQSEFPTFFERFRLKSDGPKDRFVGKIDSRKRGCVVDRRVLLFRKNDGERKKLGGDRSNRRGRFGIRAPSRRPAGARYFARAKPAKFKGGSGDRVRCRPEKSAKITID